MYLETAIEPSKPRGSGTNTLSLMHQLFEAQVKKRPDHIAVEYCDESWSYAELNRYANKIANTLRRRGIGPGHLVGLFLSKSPRLFGAMLGILKAGAGYIPIDPKFPLERIESIIDDSKAKTVISEGELAENLSLVAMVPILRLDHDYSEIVHASNANPPAKRIKTSNICYVIYTSGSTGKPKGVMIEHCNALAFIDSLHTTYKLTENERVYQGFSVAFDASVEEIWAAFSLGGTLVIPEESVSRSPLDTADFITKHKITFFSTVPTFLAMVDRDLPSVSTLVLGGEVCTPELVARWARPGRRMLNTYGPTEATVVATAAECFADQEVTIGTPLPGYEAYVLNEEQQPVKINEIGELYIGGPGVARGYCNRENLTAERFIANPFKSEDREARLYRTFDLVRCNMQGQLEFIGRCDGQVKIRGFRVELPEIEAILMEQDNIRAAAVKVIDSEYARELAAYIVLDSGNSIDRARLAEIIRKKLPEYMIPKYLDILTELPLMTSGKVDRNQLPEPMEPLLSQSREIIPPADDLEKSVLEIWQSCLGIQEISVKDNFFNDLQGHSLAAAKVTSELRVKLNTPSLSVRDIYRYNTVRSYSEFLKSIEVQMSKPSDSKREKSQAQKVYESVLVTERGLVKALQAVCVSLYYGILIAPFAYLTLMTMWVYTGQISLVNASVISSVLAFAWWPSLLFFSIAIKWLVIGRFKPGRYPVWSMYYFRWWLVTLVQKLNWSEVLMGTPLMSLYYRAMGAKIGNNVIIDSNLCNTYDTVTIADNSSIGHETQLLGYRVEDGMLVIGNIDIGRNCFIGTHCCIGLNTSMGNSSRLEDMSMLSDGETIEPGRGKIGNPAANAFIQVPKKPQHTADKGRRFTYGLYHLGLIYAMGYLLIFSLLPSILLVMGALFYFGPLVAAGVTLLAAPLFLAVYISMLWTVKKFIGKTHPGTYRLDSPQYLHHWFTDYLMRNTKTILLPFYATLYMPGLLRMLGAKIGKHSEISTVVTPSPDLLKIGDNAFLADACMIGGKRIHNGVVEVEDVSIGSNSFVGNSAFVPGGTHIDDDSLIGVMSTPPVKFGKNIPTGRWLGNPGFSLPNTQKGLCFSDAQTTKPTKDMMQERAIYDAMRILIPNLAISLRFIIIATLLVLFAQLLPLWLTILTIPLIATLTSIWFIELSALIKHICCERMQPTVQPLWCRFVWRNELVNGVYESLAAPAMNPLLGTPYIAPALRAMGTKIGKRAYIETTLFSEFDLVEIGDYASLNLGSTIQNHLFEDRVFKADRLSIGEGATVSNMSVVLYDTRMEKGSHLGSLSVLMKGERLPQFTNWAGVPCEALQKEEQKLPELNHNINMLPSERMRVIAAELKKKVAASLPNRGQQAAV